MTAPRRKPAAGPSVEPTLREVVDALCALERGPGSPGEEQAAHWLAERLTQAGAEVQIDQAEYHDGYADVIGALTATGAIAGVLARSPRTRKLAGLVAAAATALIADDISNGPRLARKARPPKATQNVVATAGDRDAPRTLVVMGHHDAAPTGAIFDDRAQSMFGDLAPGILERIDTSLPLWWAVMGGPGLVALGAKRGSTKLISLGTAISALSTAAFADINRSPIVPGANDNASADAVLVALAERLRAEPLENLKVLLVSCGAEEVIQGGIYSFAERHFPALDRENTWFLNLDTLGSPKLVLLEGEGPVVMEDYHDRSFRDLVARAADNAGAPLRRGMRARNSTDAVIPSRAGYPTATLASINRYKALTNYHTMNDTPHNLDFRTVAHAVLVAEATARELAASPWIGSA